MSESFDAIVIGAGQAGPFLAARLCDAGQKVLLVERKQLGGTCVNTGCMPTKALVASAYAAHMVRRAADYGVRVPDGVHVDIRQVHDRAQRVRLDARTGLEKWLGNIEKLQILYGQARFENENTVCVDDALFTAPRIFINVGARATGRGIDGLRPDNHLTHSSILGFPRLPEHLVVVGGGYIGLEFAQMYRRFGSQVTVVERNQRLIPHEDPEISAEVHAILESEGIHFRLGSECIRLVGSEGSMTVTVNCQSGPPDIPGTHVLVATGRSPNTDDLGLEKAGVVTDKHGYVVVDDSLATNVPGIWALGDCNGRGAFTHTAYNDFEIVAANLLDGDQRRVSDRVLGYSLYIDPPLARAGLSETEARKLDRPLLIARRPMSRVGRAVEKGETQGLMKLVVDAETRQILGAAILGTGGDEAIHGILDIMHAKQSVDVLRWSLPIHPTVSELFPTLINSLAPAE